MIGNSMRKAFGTQRLDYAGEAKEFREEVGAAVGPVGQGGAADE